MGQKVRPIGFRVGINRGWDSVWCMNKRLYPKKLHEDLAIRKLLSTSLHFSGVNRVIIERPADRTIVTIHTSRPGVLIGKKGSDIEAMRKKISTITGSQASINVTEVRKPEIEALLVSESIAQQLERRVSFRRAMKRAMQLALKMGAQGIKVSVSGRLGGAEIARTEWYREGRVPLHTIRADIGYGTATAHTTYGAIGVKVWVYKGEIYAVDRSKS